MIQVKDFQKRCLGGFEPKLHGFPLVTKFDGCERVGDEKPRHLVTSIRL